MKGRAERAGGEGGSEWERGGKSIHLRDALLSWVSGRGGAERDEKLKGCQLVSKFWPDMRSESRHAHKHIHTDMKARATSVHSPGQPLTHWFYE